MAATAEGRSLTEAHRRGQVALQTRALARMTAVWRVLDPDRLDETADGWTQAALAVLGADRQVSAALAATYLQRFRQVELGSREEPVVEMARAAVLPVDRLVAVLRINGPVYVKRQVAGGVPRDQAAASARAATAREGMRHVADGGRRAVIDTVAADPRALGWARVTSGDACAFCRLLSSRGHVYRAEETADFEAHAACGCSAEPTYSRTTPPPPGAEEDRRLYDEATRGLSGNEARVAFRRAVEGRTAPAGT